LRRILYEICFEDFLAGLSGRGYREASDREPCLKWRRQNFHVILQQKNPGKLSVHLHVDVPTALPPFHKTVKRGKELLQEFHTIIESYRKVRALTYNQPLKAN
jgi:hypothetical protein